MTDVNLQDLVRNSDLSAEDKNLWEKAFTLLNEAQVQVLADVIGTDESRLHSLTDNLKLKHAAFQTRDEKALNDVFEKQVDQVTQLANT